MILFCREFFCCFFIFFFSASFFVEMIGQVDDGFELFFYSFFNWDYREFCASFFGENILFSEFYSIENFENLLWENKISWTFFLRSLLTQLSDLFGEIWLLRVLGNILNFRWGLWRICVDSWQICKSFTIIWSIFVKIWKFFGQLCWILG